MSIEAYKQGLEAELKRQLEPTINGVKNTTTNPKPPEVVKLIHLAAEASVDSTIVRVILPQTYQMIDRLIDHIGFDAVPKDLRVACQKILPDQCKYSFVSKKAKAIKS
jgi:hypothetical protein